jgi:hypothetical protein
MIVSITPAGVAEWVYAIVSKTIPRKGLRVRVPPPAPLRREEASQTRREAVWGVFFLPGFPALRQFLRRLANEPIAGLRPAHPAPALPPRSPRSTWPWRSGACRAARASRCPASSRPGCARVFPVPPSGAHPGSATAWPTVAQVMEEDVRQTRLLQEDLQQIAGLILNERGKPVALPCRAVVSATPATSAIYPPPFRHLL